MAGPAEGGEAAAMSIELRVFLRFDAIMFIILLSPLKPSIHKTLPHTLLTRKKTFPFS